MARLDNSDRFLPEPALSRRAFLERCGMGFGLMGLAGLSDSAGAAIISASPLASHPSQYGGKAKRF